MSGRTREHFAKTAPRVVLSPGPEPGPGVAGEVAGVLRERPEAVVVLSSWAYADLLDSVSQLHEQMLALRDLVARATGKAPER